MLSSLREQKFRRLFHLYDADNNGFIDEGDFMTVAARVAASRGVKRGDDLERNLRAAFLILWANVRTSTDMNRDGRISMSEWLQSHEELTADPSRYQASVCRVTDVVFKAFDVHGKGEITSQEYENFCRALAIDVDQAPAIFTRLDGDGDGKINRAEFLRLMDDFNQSEDPAAPGNWMFGKPEHIEHAATVG